MLHKRRKGFTLVEVIVVVVIVGILAAVAVPIYLAYINGSRQGAVDQLAQTATAAADGFYRKTGSDPVVADLNLFYDQTKFTITVAPPDITVFMTLRANFTKTVSYRQ